MSFDELRTSEILLFECVSGSRALGLATEQSDTDIKGVFIVPEERLFGFDRVQTISDPRNDRMYYEIEFFLDLCDRNNPNILEMLHTPESLIRYEDPAFRPIREFPFLSKRCRETFVNYAMGQIKKSRGLNKKIANPMPEQRLGVLDFCWVTHENGSLPLKEWLAARGLRQSDCGLSSLDHFPGVYLLHHQPGIGLRGIVGDEAEAADVRLSSIPKGLQPQAHLYYNHEAFKAHCRQHKDYWEWVDKRNEARYRTNTAHGKNYDSKNMMHVFRLLEMAGEIAARGALTLHSREPEFLLQIKSGAFEYDDLIERAEKKTAELETLFAASTLPHKPDTGAIEQLLIQCRREIYRRAT